MRAAAAILLCLVAGTALAQPLPPPDLENRIPAPLPPPPQAPVINGPLGQGRGTAPPPARLNTFSDKVGRCLDEAALAARDLGERDAYTRMCANVR